MYPKARCDDCDLSGVEHGELAAGLVGHELAGHHLAQARQAGVTILVLGWSTLCLIFTGMERGGGGGGEGGGGGGDEGGVGG